MSEMDPAEAAALLYGRYMAAHEAYDADEHDGPHPSKDVTRWGNIAATGGRDEGGLGPERIQGARSDRGAGLGPVEIQNKAKDEVQPSESERGNAGAEPAQDGRYSLDSAGVPRYETAGGQVIVGDAALEANARRSNPARVQRMSAAIKGLDRLP
jgi:hypothetical protein